jgi:hypothetical protein
MSDLFVAVSESPTGIALSGSSALYNSNLLSRGYSVNNPAIYQYGTDLDVKVTDANIKSAVQFGNHAFLLTDESVIGTSYRIGDNYDSDYYSENHAVVTYVPGTTTSQINKVITNCAAVLASTSQNIYYGTTLDDGTTLVYVKSVDIDARTWSDWQTKYDFVNDTDASLIVSPYERSYIISGAGFAKSIYEVSGDIRNLVSGTPYYGIDNAYLFTLTDGFSGEIVGRTEDGVLDLKVLDTGRTPLAYRQSAGTFGALPFAYMLEQSLENEDYIDETSGVMYVNPFLLKNMYDTDWRTRVSQVLSGELLGLRSYQSVGKSQDMIWTSYKYKDRRYLTNAPWFDYEFVERIAGLHKLQTVGGHKSNIYSIKINNSGLNERITDTELRDRIQTMVEKSIRNAVIRITPSHTQLWKVMWTGI